MLRCHKTFCCLGYFPNKWDFTRVKADGTFLFHSSILPLISPPTPLCSSALLPPSQLYAGKAQIIFEVLSHQSFRVGRFLCRKSLVLWRGSRKSGFLKKHQQSLIRLNESRRNCLKGEFLFILFHLDLTELTCVTHNRTRE